MQEKMDRKTERQKDKERERNRGVLVAASLVDVDSLVNVVKRESRMGRRRRKRRRRRRSGRRRGRQWE